MVKGNRGAQLENLVACSLLKEVHFQQDIIGANYDLHYLRTKDGIKVDFLIAKDDAPTELIEVKLSDSNFAPSLNKFFKENKDVKKTQLVENLDREKTFQDGSRVTCVKSYLSKIIF